MNNQGIIVTFAVIFMQAAVKSGKKQQQKTQSNMKVKIQTMLGDIVVRLYDETPIHRDNFI